MSGTTEDGTAFENHERRNRDGWILDGASRRTDVHGVAVEEGSYALGVRVGRWTTRHPNGAVASEGSYLFGEREGVWIFRAPDGMVDDEQTGVYEDGERASSWYEEGSRTGRLKSGALQKATYAHGLRNGPALGFHPGGERESEGSYADGLRTGPWTYLLPSGAIDREKSGVYRLDVKVADLEAETKR